MEALKAKPNNRKNVQVNQQIWVELPVAPLDYRMPVKGTITQEQQDNKRSCHKEK
ncbi:hypothetical protein [Segetibacter koreensis]|uniref:hypothetical protein n=1 Tax=Segetibacter koreensis TaxID=398037 RepID=UPI00037689B8|nr:hypothetical protein [Segetibacter koreensis]